MCSPIQVGKFVSFLKAFQKIREYAIPVSIHFAEVRDDDEAKVIFKFS